MNGRILPEKAIEQFCLKSNVVLYSTWARHDDVVDAAIVSSNMGGPLQVSSDRLACLAVVVPAWQPGPPLLALVAELRQLGSTTLIVVDDGSDASHQDVFASLHQTAQVHLVRHAVNLGKGRALKTAWNLVLTTMPHITGVVTVDADGQHCPADVLRVAEALLSSPERMVLGCRAFDAGVPLRSRFGNLLTRRIFAVLTGVTIADTQTGLRGIPRALLPELMALDGERYEYEMSVLAHVCRHSLPPLQVPIATVYLDGNRSSHFDPVRDSMRIYFVLARFYTSSVVAAAIDLFGFSVCFAVTHHLLLSIVTGRLSSLVNYLLNRRFVFHSRGPLSASLWRYYLLVALIGGMSYLAVRGLTTHLHTNVFVAKVLVDTVLSLLSFSAQRTFVFRRGRTEAQGFADWRAVD